MQLTIGLGSLALENDLLGLLRVLLVNSTKPIPCTDQIPLVSFRMLSGNVLEPSIAPVKDDPRTRRLYRRMTDCKFGSDYYG
jgi:hypothetical protein